MIDPSRERIFELRAIPAELEKLGVLGPNGGRVHRSFGYRLKEQGLEILVVSGRLFTSREALIRLFHARTRARQQALVPSDDAAKTEAIAASERLKRLVFRRRAHKAKE